MTSHVYVGPRSRISGAIPPLNHTYSWHVQGHLYFKLQSVKYVTNIRQISKEICTNMVK
jgi:hypothetical protein